MGLGEESMKGSDRDPRFSSSPSPMQIKTYKQEPTTPHHHNNHSRSDRSPSPRSSPCPRPRAGPWNCGSRRPGSCSPAASSGPTARTTSAPGWTCSRTRPGCRTGAGRPTSPGSPAPAGCSRCSTSSTPSIGLLSGRTIVAGSRLSPRPAGSWSLGRRGPLLASLVKRSLGLRRRWRRGGTWAPLGGSWVIAISYWKGET